MSLTSYYLIFMVLCVLTDKKIVKFEVCGIVNISYCLKEF